MGRIDKIFAAGRTERRGLVMPFITAGDPSLEVTLRLVAAFERAGAAAVELGFPFSDPIADGPVIAGSMHDALLRGTTPEAIFAALSANRSQTAAQARASAHAALDRDAAPRMAEPANANDAMGKTAMARLAMVSVSIVERMGTRSFVAAAADAGFDGLIVPDADLLASDLLSEACAEADIACAFLVAPTSTPERVAAIVHRCRGFVYLLARAGVTGDAVGVGASERRTSDRQEARAPRSGGAANGRPTNAPALARQVAAIRAVNPTIPIAAGFGIATPEHVAATVAHVDAAIVGTALVRRIRDAVASGADPVAEAEGFVAALVAAAQAAASAANP